MKLFIPACGDRLVLDQPWTFSLYLERRNMKFAQTLGFVTEEEIKKNWSGIFAGEPYRSSYREETVTLQAGDMLECDRVYIRVFSKSKTADDVENDYDSITWKLMRKGKPVRHGRFWVKLSECNRIEYRLDPDSLYRDRVKNVRAVLEA